VSRDGTDDQAPEPGGDRPGDRRPPSGPAAAARRAPRDDDAPVLPRTAGEDSARAWGDDERGDDDERFLRERPPHW
jgi:hypothetical protein